MILWGNHISGPSVVCNACRSLHIVAMVLAHTWLCTRVPMLGYGTRVKDVKTALVGGSELSSCLQAGAFRH